jgi:hypothetical protein
MQQFKAASAQGGAGLLLSALLALLISVLCFALRPDLGPQQAWLLIFMLLGSCCSWTREGSYSSINTATGDYLGMIWCMPKWSKLMENPLILSDLGSAAILSF